MNTDRDLIECRTDAALYALGTLPPEEAQRFEQRLRSGCPFCTAESVAFAEAAENLVLSVAPQEPPPLLRERVLKRISAIERESDQPKDADERSASPDKDMIIVRGADSPWIPLPVAGADIRPLLGQQTFLVRMAPGTVYPVHMHEQSEQCYVLEGSITDSDGITAHAGDFVCMRAGTQHEPIHTDTGCVLLIAYTA